jgi:hypothetical protein
MVLCVLVVLPLNLTNAFVLACRLVDRYEYRRHRQTGLTGDIFVCILIGVAFVATLTVCLVVMGVLALLLH